jgi:hypothetical protein
VGLLRSNITPEKAVNRINVREQELIFNIILHMFHGKRYRKIISSKSLLKIRQKAVVTFDTNQVIWGLCLTV